MASAAIMHYLTLVHECERECRAQQRHVICAGTTLRRVQTAWDRAGLRVASGAVSWEVSSNWSRACPPPYFKRHLMIRGECQQVFVPRPKWERCAGSRRGARTPTEHLRGASYVSPRLSRRPVLFRFPDIRDSQRSIDSDHHLFHLSEAATPESPDAQLQQGLSYRPSRFTGGCTSCRLFHLV